MADVVVMGGGICGLLTSMLLARDGKSVIVLERDKADAPDSVDAAWAGWQRGVPQFHQTHNFHPLFRRLVEAELPDVLDALVAAGGLRVDYLDWMPPTITDRSSRPGDDRFWTVTGRRPIFESIIARMAAREPGLTVRRGVKVAGLKEA